MARQELYLNLLGFFLAGLTLDILRISVGVNKGTSCLGVIRAESWIFIEVYITFYRVNQYLSLSSLSMAWPRESDAFMGTAIFNNQISLLICVDQGMVREIESEIFLSQFSRRPFQCSKVPIAFGL